MFEQRYYRNFDTLSLCRPVVLSGYVQTEHVAVGKVLKQRYNRNLNTLSFWRPVLFCRNIQSEHAAAGEIFQTTILWEHEPFKPLRVNVTFR